MRRTALEIIRNLEMRIARLERSSSSEYIREYLRQNPHMDREEALEFMLEQGGMGVEETPSKIELTIDFTSLNSRNEKRFVKSVSNLGLPLTTSPRHKSGGALYLHFLPIDFSKFWRVWVRRSPELIQKHGVTISQMSIYDGHSFIKGEENIASHVKGYRKRGQYRQSSRIDVVKINDLLIQDRSLQNISGFERDWMDKELGPYWSKDGGDTLVQPQYIGSRVKISIFNAFDVDDMRDLTRFTDLSGKSSQEAAGIVSDMIMSSLKKAGRRAKLERQSSNMIKLEVVKYIDNFYDEYYEMIEGNPEMEGVYGEEGDKEIVSSETVKDFNSLMRSLSYLKRELDGEFEWEGDLRDYLTGRRKNLPKLIAYVEQDYFMESVEVSITSTDRFSKDQLEQITKSL